MACAWMLHVKLWLLSLCACVMPSLAFHTDGGMGDNMGDVQVITWNVLLSAHA